MRLRILRNFLLSAAFSLLAFAGFAQTITFNTTLSNLSGTYGDIVERSFSFTGTGFTPSTIMRINPSPGFEVSTSAGGTYSSFVDLTSNGSGNFTSTTIYVRLIPNTNVGLYSGNSVLLEYPVGTIIDGQTIPNSTITARTLDITGISISSKVYNASTSATITGTPALFNLMPADVGTVTLVTGGESANFINANVGNFKSVTISGYTLAGPTISLNNYILNQPTRNANITAKPLTVSGLSANNRDYDGTTVFNLSGTPALVGVEGVDAGNVSLNGTLVGSVVSAAVGTGKTVTTSGASLTGSAAGNYTLTNPSFTADINAKTLTISATQVNKTYGTALTSGAGYTGFNAVGLVSGENAGTVTVTYGAGAAANANVGTYNNSVVLTSLTGGSGGFNPSNYTIGYADANIVVGAKTLTISGAGVSNKPYDGNTSTSIFGGVSLVGVESGDDCTIDATFLPSGTFASANAANGISVTITGYALTGAAAGNYILTQPTGITANITPKALTITA
ncbi:YDG domain-containing protein, partial [Sediminibacterium sp.]|uniref:YDG domain-containing protein n=1 Tax=Sediminibacterium sp. TaxID=1917865 RepID=UPI0025E9416B